LIQADGVDPQVSNAGRFAQPPQHIFDKFRDEYFPLAIFTHQILREYRIDTPRVGHGFVMLLRWGWRENECPITVQELATQRLVATQGWIESQDSD
jgi:hypothetical protein